MWAQFSVFESCIPGLIKQIELGGQRSSCLHLRFILTTEKPEAVTGTLDPRKNYHKRNNSKPVL